MKKVQWMAAALAGLSLTSAVSADEPLPPAAPATHQPAHPPAHVVEPDGRISQLEAELEALKCRLDAPAPVVYQNCPSQPAPAAALPSGFYVGAEAVFIRPSLDHVDVFTRETGVGTVAEVFRSEAFDFDYEVTPRVYAGFTGENGFGIRGAWWHYEDTAEAEAVAGPNDTLVGGAGFLDVGPGNLLGADYDLHLETFDLEGTSLFQVGSSVLTAGAGFRYLDIEQRYSGAGISPVGDVLEAARGQNDFDGIGPTFSLAAVQPVLGGFSFYAKSRMSVLFGEREQRFDAFDALGTIAAREDRDDETVTIGEVGVGVMYTHENFFLNGGWEGQMWWNAGGNVAGIDNTATDIGLQGFNVGGGILW